MARVVGDGLAASALNMATPAILLIDLGWLPSVVRFPDRPQLVRTCP